MFTSDISHGLCFSVRTEIHSPWTSAMPAAERKWHAYYYRPLLSCSFLEEVGIEFPAGLAETALEPCFFLELRELQYQFPGSAPLTLHHVTGWGGTEGDSSSSVLLKQQRGQVWFSIVFGQSKAGIAKNVFCGQLPFFS